MIAPAGPIHVTWQKLAIPFFIATYTAPNGSQGIYKSTLDLETGALSQPILAAATPNPSYLAISPDRRWIACVNEQNPGQMTLFSLSPEDELHDPRVLPLQGKGPCFLQFLPDSQSLLAASYGSGDFECVSLAGKPLWGWNNVQAGQSPPHAHCLQPLPNSPFAVGTDLGRDLVLTFRDGRPVQAHVLAAGSPRHFAFDPTGKRLYVGSEHGNSVTTLEIDRESGAMTETQTLSTLPMDFQGNNTTAEVLLHPSGKWLYVSNRGHDSIACFPRLPNGVLAKPSIATIAAKTPRGMAIDPSGRYLLVAGQENGIVTSLKIDGSTGLPSPTGFEIKLSKPVHMLFLD